MPAGISSPPQITPTTSAWVGRFPETFSPHGDSFAACSACPRPPRWSSIFRVLWDRHGQSVALTGDVSFQSANAASGREIAVRILAGASSRSLAFPGGWRFVGASAPALLAAKKTALLILRSFSSADADVVAKYEVEP